MYALLCCHKKWVLMYWMCQLSQKDAKYINFPQGKEEEPVNESI